MKRLRQRLLTFLRVSERPDPPPGAGPFLETFRASRRYLYYCVLTWIPKQIAAFFGLLFSLAFFGFIDQPFVKMAGLDRFFELVERIRFPFGHLNIELNSLFVFFEALAIVTWAAQLLFTGLLLKLSWELRWYMVGETSLRIRRGLWSLREQTMTLANIQNMIVRQGPVQRMFGIADLEVHTAGGGARSDPEEGDSSGAKHSLHIGHLRGLEDAPGLRDKIRARLLELAGDGLGDGREPRDEPSPVSATRGDLLEAARALEKEARLLRGSLTSPG
ncbi:MAG: PH domain-containing protein [Acidobacteriota bacterium]|nr:PH domain-containing protein [Acidobacteriota bacterium]